MVITQGGFLGGTRAPGEYCQVIVHFAAPIVIKWLVFGIGLSIEGVLMNHAVWAGNTFLLANARLKKCKG